MVAIGRTELTLWFGEPVDERASSFTVRTAATPARPGPVQTTVDLRGRPGASSASTTPPLERGTYAIGWAVVADDGHPTQGTITFGAGLRPDGATA